MVDLITGDVGGAAVSSDQVATGAFEGQDWFKTTTQAGDLLSRGFEEASHSGSLGEFPTGMLPTPKADEPTISAEEANAQFGQKSLTGIVPDLTFDKPLPAHLAAAQAQEWHDHVARADAIARAPGGFWSGAARFGASTAVFMLDPLNLAASLVPVVSEARVAGALARAGMEAGTSAFGRAATRMATGVVSGSVNQTPLIALRGGLSWADHGDYSAADAMADLVMGGAIGGGLHTVIGGVRDFMGRGFLATPAAREIEANPVAREGAMRTAVAQLAEGRPVEIDGIVNVSAAERAESELRSWAQQHSIIDAQEDAALARATSLSAPPDRSATIEAANNRVSQLQAELAQHQVEIGRVRVRAGEGVVDPATATRIAEIHTELAGAIPAARRGALEQELTMLVEGRDTAADALETGRAAAETRGLQASAGRAEQALAKAQAELQQLQTTAATEAQQAAAARLAADKTLRVHEIAAASRRAVLQALQARSLRRFAGAIGAELQPGEAESLAQSINTLGGLTRETILQDLSNRRGGVVRLTGGGPGPSMLHEAAGIGQPLGRGFTASGPRSLYSPEVYDALAQGVRALRTERDGTLAEMSGSDAVARARGLPGPEEQALRQATAQAQELAKALKPERPELPPEVEDAAAIEKQWKDMQGAKAAKGQAAVPDQTRGMLTAAERAELRQMDEEFAQAKKDGDVWEAAASCMTGEPNAG